MTTKNNLFNGYIIHLNGTFTGYFFNYPEKYILKQYCSFAKKCEDQFNEPIFETLDTIENDKIYKSDHVEIVTTTTWICKKPDGSWDDMLTLQVSRISWQDVSLESLL